MRDEDQILDKISLALFKKMNFSRLGGEKSDEPSSDNCSSSSTVFLAGLFFTSIAEGDMRSAVSSSDDGSSTCTAFLTVFFSLRQIFDPDTPAPHSWGWGGVGVLGRHYCHVI